MNLEKTYELFEKIDFAMKDLLILEKPVKVELLEEIQDYLYDIIMNPAESCEENGHIWSHFPLIDVVDCARCGDHKKDPHLNLNDFENMTKEEMKEKMREMEDIILCQMMQLTDSYICPKCVEDGSIKSMDPTEVYIEDFDFRYDER